jgi:predicted transcriptional regulator
MVDGVEEPEAAFQFGEDEGVSPHDPRAEALARARGMSEDEIAMIKAGLQASRAGRVSPSSEVFARLAKRYGR